MIVSAAVCPHPPVLVPQLSGGAAPELQTLRDAAEEAVSELLSAMPQVLVVVGGAAQTARHDVGCAGSLAGFGLDLRVALGADAQAAPDLPLSLTVGAWLLAGRTAGAELLGQQVAMDASTAGCAQIGAELARAADRVALLVMGDGSACRSALAPGYFDARASGFDDEVAAALGSADVDALLRLDVQRAAELLVAGRAAWQVLAGAVKASAAQVPVLATWRARILDRQAPYGVDYVVAAWSAQ